MADTETLFLNLVVERGLASQQVAQECVQRSRANAESLPRLLMDRARIPEAVARELYQEAQRRAQQQQTPSGHGDLSGYVSDTAHDLVSASSAGNTPPSGALIAPSASPPPADAFGSHPGGTRPGFGGPATASGSGPLASGFGNPHASARGTAAPPQPGWAPNASNAWSGPGGNGSSSGSTWNASGSHTITPASLRPGTVFNRYRLDSELGRGGMGIVWRARQVDLDRDVAVKMLLQGTLATEKLRKRFIAEAKAVARLVHPNVVTVHDVGDENGILFFTMDFVDGPSLGDMLKTQRLTVKRALEIAHGISEGLDHAHKNGIVHRDLKPANILIDPRGTPRITDFGIAKDTTQQSTTQHGEVLGTPAYMSPEQANGGTDVVDGRSDLYSLGAILYRMLTGAPPFGGDSPYDIITKVLHDKPKPTRDANKEVPKALDDLVLKLLSKKPEQRYDSASQVARELKQMLRGMERNKRGTTQRLRQQDRRRLLLASGVGGVLLVVGVVLGVVGWNQLQEKKALEQQIAEKEAEQSQRDHELKLEQLRTEALGKVEDARRLADSSPEEALAKLEEVSSTLVDHAPTQLLLGRLLLEHRKDATAAVLAFDAALKADPKNLDALRWKGKALLTLNRGDDLEATAQALEQHGAKGRAAAEELRCDQKHRQGEVAVALVHLEKALRESPDERLRLKRIRLFLEAKRYASAEEAASVCVRLNSGSADALALRAQARLELGRKREAKSDVQKALSLDPDQALAKRLEPKLANVGVRPRPRPRPRPGPGPGHHGAGDKARHNATHAALKAAFQALRRRDMRAVQQNLQRAMAEYPLPCEPSLIERIELLVMVRQPKLARRDLKTWAKLPPKNIGLFYSLAFRVELALKNYPSALRACSELAKRLPPDKRDRAYSMEASVYQQQGDFQKEVEALTKAIEVNDKVVNHFHIRAHAYVKLGDGAKALADAEKALTFKPKNGHFQLIRGQALELLKKPAEAKAAYQKAIDLGSPKDQQSARERLSKLK